MSIANNVKARRLARDMTQAELADRAGITQAIVSKIESGEDNIKIETLRGLAAALGCAATDLLPDEDKRRRSRA